MSLTLYGAKAYVGIRYSYSLAEQAFLLLKLFVTLRNPVLDIYVYRSSNIHMFMYIRVIYTCLCI